ncbi:class I SAM-dependent methyltransferase [Planctomicrobium piriforme]|uniref:Trans-aconitate 2-methyltransferase n=1 Tax=Planctomicrobium piriforme TaxID=1576369 RepID=A0A1I3AT93_9PLAN|nr:class I SAM-dependent methyltransferase [Planctomicrobium piriforme]SFH53307.1 trans-aconitate 2-methyltransferase [Planctomicrobium piriforme]
MAIKDFGPIESDYAFFMKHATEAESDVAAYVNELKDFAKGRASIRLLDFGCGTGEFTQRFASTLNWPPHVLRMTLVEPVPHQLSEAAQRLAAFSTHPIESLQSLPLNRKRCFDLVLSNHVLYYVEDLDSTLGQMCESLGPWGKLLLAIAGWENPLIQLWKTGFEMLGRSIPYSVSEDVESVLQRRGTPYLKSKAFYQLRFIDTEENRLKIIRFLFGEHLQELSPRRLLKELDPFARREHIEISTESDHYTIDSPQVLE